MTFLDWKALSQVSTQLQSNGCFCHFCDMQKEERGDLTKKGKDRKLSLFGGKISNFAIMFCPLHAKLRVVGNLLVLFVKSKKNQRELEKIEKKIREIPLNRKFQFRQKPETLDATLDTDQVDVEAPFLNGTQADALLQHFPVIFQGQIKRAEEHIWKLTAYIFHSWIDVSQDTIEGQNPQHLTGI